MEKDGRKQRRVGLLFDERMYKHKQASGIHVENPERIRAIWDNLKAVGLLQRCVVLNAKEADDDHLSLVHSKEHIDLIKTISSKSLKNMRRIASKYNSIYFNKGSSEAAYLAAGYVIEATEKVAKGELDSAFAIVRPPGHHAEESEPMGFCLFNNVAVAASVILNERPELGIKKILIVDWDVHHGNSTQKMFYKDPRVLVFSVHRHDFGSFYPEGNDGSYKMMGEGLGAGYNINIPWEGGGVGDADYFAVWDHILLPVAREFDPGLIIISAGFDAAAGDPIGGCCLSPYGYSIMLYKLMGFARGKIVMALEGGYNPISLANATQVCIEMLLDYKPPISSLEDLPLKPTWPLIKTVRQNLCIYWPILAAKIPDEMINSRLHIEVNAETRQDEVYDQTPVELEHGMLSGRQDYIEDQGRTIAIPSSFTSSCERVRQMADEAPARVRRKFEPHSHLIEWCKRRAEARAALGKTTEVDTGRPASRQTTTAARQSPPAEKGKFGDAIVVEADPRASKKAKSVGIAEEADRSKLAGQAVEPEAVAPPSPHRPGGEREKRAAYLQELENTNRKLKAELEEMKKTIMAQEEVKRKMDSKMKSLIDSERKAVSQYSSLVHDKKIVDKEVQQLKEQIARMEVEKEDRRLEYIKLLDESRAQRQRIARLLVKMYTRKELRSSFKLGYMIGYAECLRVVHFAKERGHDIIEALKIEFDEFVKANPLNCDCPLSIEDLADIELDPSIFGDTDVHDAGPSKGPQGDVPIGETNSSGRAG